MTEDAMLEGGRTAQRNIEHAGFSEELKESSKSESKLPHLRVKMRLPTPSSICRYDRDTASAGQGTRETAAAPAWTGTESLADSALRMLDDASKPIRRPYKIPQPVDLRPAPKVKHTPGSRLAKAKEQTSAYAMSKSAGLTEEERNEMRREMRDTLSPGAHEMPISIGGLTSLANQRIDDAIARGQFKKIPRGKGVNTETDYNANSAFIDTTDYFMNKIIQRQEIVPPWIEKQQEILTELNRFRQRIRAEWRRHAARLIASQGGSLEDQMRRARAHAAAEVRLEEKARIEAELSDTSPAEEPSSSEIKRDGRIASSQPSGPAGHTSEEAESLPHLPPLRDPDYMSIERSYHELSVQKLNSLIRSYNLQAPRSAQKPYISLDRELRACYAEVAPGLAEEIRRRTTERARGPVASSSPSSILGSLGPGPSVTVYEEDKAKGYGMKEFWRDLFAKDKN
ncbi:hypothetical protein N7470_008216 [Penicillium chermesinum]|nr:hypothetical protein N7470_008216 [Penicillium chermesinum]